MKRFLLLLLSLYCLSIAATAGNHKWTPPADGKPVYSSDSLEVLMVHPEIGYTIDVKERNKYQFFAHYYFPRVLYTSAQFLKKKSGEIVIRAQLLDGRVFERDSSFKELNYCFRKVDRFEERKRAERVIVMLSILASALIIH